MKKMMKIAVAGAATMALLGISITPAAAAEKAPTYQTVDECLGTSLTATSVNYPKTLANNPTEGEYPFEAIEDYELGVYLPCEVYLEKNRELYESWKYMYNMASISVQISESLPSGSLADIHYQNQAKRYLSQIYLWGLVPMIDGADENTMDVLFGVFEFIQEGDLTSEGVEFLGVSMIWHMAWLVEKDAQVAEINKAIDNATGKKVRKALKKLKLPQVQQTLIFGYLEVLDSTDSLFASVSDQNVAKKLTLWLADKVVEKV